MTRKSTPKYEVVHTSGTVALAGVSKTEATQDRTRHEQWVQGEAPFGSPNEASRTMTPALALPLLFRAALVVGIGCAVCVLFVVGLLKFVELM